MTQEVNCLTSKHKVLSSTPKNSRKRERERERERERRNILIKFQNYKQKNVWGIVHGAVSLNMNSKCLKTMSQFL
jgi:queuine/archaeosine tRNA-ribosyltransferase